MGQQYQRYLSYLDSSEEKALVEICSKLPALNSHQITEFIEQHEPWKSTPPQGELYLTRGGVDRGLRKPAA